MGLPQPHFDQWASLLPSMDAFMAPPDDDDGPHTDQADRRRTQFAAASDPQPRVDAPAQKTGAEECVRYVLVDGERSTRFFCVIYSPRPQPNREPNARRADARRADADEPSVRHVVKARGGARHHRRLQREEFT